MGSEGSLLGIEKLNRHRDVSLTVLAKILIIYKIIYQKYQLIQNRILRLETALTVFGKGNWQIFLLLG